MKTILKQIKDRKSPGKGNVPAEVLTADVDSSTDHILHPLLKKIWNEEKIPADWKNDLIIRILKKDKTKCENWCRIILLSIPSKVSSKIFLNRLEA